MSFLRKFLRRAVMAVSWLLLPRHVRNVRMHRGEHFDLLVLANEDVGRQLVFLGSYEPMESAYLRAHIAPTDICLDVGGNVGYFSLLMATAAREGAVHVFEPIPLNAALIRASLALNGLSHVHVNELALGDVPGTVSFSVSRDSAYSSMRPIDRSPEAAAIEAPALTLDTYLRERDIRRVDVLKIDVEGAEGMVLSGGAGLLGNPAARPRLVLMELFDPGLAPFGTSKAELLARMRAFGYTPWVIVDGKGRLESFDVTRHARYYNVLFTSQ